MNLFNRIKFASAVFDNNPEAQKLLKSGQLKIASDIKQPPKRPDVIDMEAINAFIKRNRVEKADGGMLVKPGFDGVRQGYRKDKTGHQQETKKLLNWINKNKNTFDFANSSSADVLKASKVNLGIGTIQKYLAEEGIQTKTAIAKTQDKPKYTKKVLEELRKDLPAGISVEQGRPGKYYFRIMLKGGKAGKETYRNSWVANEANKQIAIDDFNRVSKEYYPGRLTDQEFKDLRLKNKDMTTEQFAKFLDSKNKTTYLGEKWNKASVSTLQNRLNIGVGTTGPLVKRTVEEARAIIDQYPGAKFFYLQNPSDSQITQYASDLVSREKLSGKGGQKGFPIGGTKEGKMFRNFYDSSLKADGRMQLITEVPKDADGRINWKKKDANGVPAWKKAKFFDKKTKATFSWGANYKPGDLEKQVDAAYSKGFFKNSVKVYDEQAALNKKTFKGRALNEIFREGLLKRELEIKLGRFLTNSKADQKLLKEFYALRKKNFSFTEAHHIEGVGNNPFRMELSYRAANRKQNNLLNSYNAGNITKAEYIAGMENLGDTKGGIRFKTNGRFIGTTGTTESIIKAAAKDINMKPAQVKKIISDIGCDPKASGGRVGYESGTACFKKGIDAINNNKIKTPSQAKNFEKLLRVGRNITKYGIIPEALFLTGESLIRLGLGDNPKEALLLASEYLLPGDQKKIADRSMYTRLLNENSANIIERVNNYKKELNKLDSLKSQKDNASNLTTTGKFDYFTQTQKDVDKYYNPLIKKQEALVEKFKRPETEEVYAKRMKDEATDIRTSDSLLTKAKKLSKDMAMDDDIYNIEQLKAPEKIIDIDMFPKFENFREFMKKPEVRDDINLMNVKDEDLINFAIENNQDPEIYLQYKKALKSGYDINNLASDNMFGAEQLYGAQGHAGVPIELDMSKLEGPTSSRYEGFSPRFASGGIARIPLSDGTDINKEKINLDEIVKNIVGERKPHQLRESGVGSTAGIGIGNMMQKAPSAVGAIEGNKEKFIKSFLWAFENAEKEEKENIIKQWETKMGNVSINLTNMATGIETKGAEYLSNKIGLENALPTRIDENSVVEVIASLDLPKDFQAKMSAAQNLAGDDILDLTIKNNIFGISFNEEEGSGSTIEASGMLKFDEQGLKFKPAITKDDKNFITKSLNVAKTVGDEGVIGLNIAQGEENNLNKVGISFGSPINTKNLDFGNISLQTTTETSDNKDKTDSGITYTFPDGSTTIGATFERDNTKGEDVKKYEFEKYLDNSKLFAKRKEGDKGTNLNYGVKFTDGILDGLTIDKQNFLKYGKKFDLNKYNLEPIYDSKGKIIDYVENKSDMLKNRGMLEIGASLNNELEPNFNIMFTKKFDGNYNKKDKPYNYSYSGNELDEIYEEYQKTDGFTKEPIKPENRQVLYSQGGIVGLTKTIAPESGPKPQGLPYVYNNVKKI
jgi:hypothetical protein